MLGALWRALRQAFSTLLRRPADPAPPRREGHFLVFQLLQNDRVQAELALTPGQIAHIRGAVRATRLRRRPEVESLRAKGVEPFRRQMPALRAAIASEVLGRIERAALLTPEQKARLRQIVWQNCGPGVFGDPAVKAALGITAAQQAALRDGVEDSRRRAREAGRADEGPPAGRVAAVRQEAMSNALALLSDEQRQRWRELVGRPFEVGPGAASPEPPDDDAMTPGSEEEP